MSTRKKPHRASPAAKRQARPRRTLLQRSMECCASIAVTDAWNAAWRAAKAPELQYVTLQNFLQAFVAAMRAEVEKKAAQLGVQS